jgi:hypothetical protein
MGLALLRLSTCGGAFTELIAVALSAAALPLVRCQQEVLPVGAASLSNVTADAAAARAVFDSTS